MARPAPTMRGRGCDAPQPPTHPRASVIVPDQWQTYETQDSLAYSGHHHVALDEVPRLPPCPPVL